VGFAVQHGALDAALLLRALQPDPKIVDGSALHVVRHRAVLSVCCEPLPLRASGETAQGQRRYVGSGSDSSATDLIVRDALVAPLHADGHALAVPAHDVEPLAVERPERLRAVAVLRLEVGVGVLALALL